MRCSISTIRTCRSCQRTPRARPTARALAAQSAIQDGAELIIGPLFAGEVSGAAPVARQGEHSDDRLLQRPEGRRQRRLSLELPRRARRAAHRLLRLSRGKRNFAVLVPQSPYGRHRRGSLRQKRRGGRRSGRPCARASRRTTANAMLGPVRQVANAMKAGSRSMRCSCPRRREELPSLAPLLASNGVTSKQRAVPRHRAMGLSQCRRRGGAGRRLVSRRLTRSGWGKFAASYAKTYGAAPPRIASLAYDAVSLAVSLSANPPGQRYTATQLTRRERLLPGSTACSACCPTAPASAASPSSKCAQTGRRVIEPAPSSFASASNIEAKRQARGSAGRAPGGLCRVACTLVAWRA